MAVKYYMIIFVFSFLFLSCGKDEGNNNFVIHDYRVIGVLYAKGSKLKQISYAESVGAKGGLIIVQYEYDQQGRIYKVSQPMYENGTSMVEDRKIVGLFSYSTYVYNAKNQIEKIDYYHSNIDAGFLNLETSIYSYDEDGNNIKIQKEYPQINETDVISYFYEDGQLLREDHYDGFSKKVHTYIKYEYNNLGELTQEISYSGEDNLPYYVTKHGYQDGLNVISEIFNLSNNEKIREIKRYYDKNDNLIYLESKELSLLSSAMSYVSKYEYH